jgi:hypothetical protein
VLAQARARPGGEIVVTGHTDRVGSMESNDALSLQRARAIRERIIADGFDPNRIMAVGRGEREPAVDTPTKWPSRATGAARSSCDEGWARPPAAPAGPLAHLGDAGRQRAGKRRAAGSAPFEDTMAQRTMACTACHGEQAAPAPTATTRAWPASPPATCTTSCSTFATAGASTG